MFDSKTGNEYNLVEHEIAPVVSADFHMNEKIEVWNVGCIAKVITAGRTLFDINEMNDTCGHSPFKGRDCCEEIIIGLVFKDGRSLSLIIEIIGYTELMTTLIANQEINKTVDVAPSQLNRNLKKDELTVILRKRANFRLFMQLTGIYIFSILLCLSDWVGSTSIFSDEITIGVISLAILTIAFNYKSRLTRFSYFKDQLEKEYYSTIYP